MFKKIVRRISPSIILCTASFALLHNIDKGINNPLKLDTIGKNKLSRDENFALSKSSSTPNVKTPPLTNEETSQDLSNNQSNYQNQINITETQNSGSLSNNLNNETSNQQENKVLINTPKNDKKEKKDQSYYLSEDNEHEKEDEYEDEDEYEEDENEHKTNQDTRENYNINPDTKLNPNTRTSNTKTNSKPSTIASSQSSNNTKTQTTTKQPIQKTKTSNSPQTTKPATNQATKSPNSNVTPIADTLIQVKGKAVDVGYGTVQVEIIYNKNLKKIIDIKALQLPIGRSSQYSNYAEPLLKSRAIKAQSANIDFASGASYTSKGYIASLQSAIDQSK